MNPRPLRTAYESLGLLVLAVVINLVFFADPGFLSWGAAPYLLTSVVIAAFRGVPAGLLQLVWAALLGLVLVPVVASWFGFLSHWDMRATGIATGLTLAGLLTAGYTRHLRTVVRRRVLDRLRSLVVKNGLLQRQVSGLTRVNRVLEERVSNQIDSMTILRNQVRKLARLNLDQALQAILETVQMFTEMSAGAIYVLSQGSRTLRVAGNLGWDEGAQAWEVPLEGSVVGYVFRNGKPFSLRMMLESQEFSTYSTGPSIMAYPIRVEGKVWGVLDVTGLPFERYSSHTESVIEMVLGLAEPHLRDILDYESVYQHYEHDPLTGLPLVTQLFRNLDRDLEKMEREGTPVSVVILEILNYEDLERLSSPDETKNLLLEIKKGLDGHFRSKTRVFHYRSANQLAVLATGLDQDGTTFYGMELQALIPRLGITLRGVPVAWELLVGVATARANSSGEDLLMGAENLIALQRL